MIVIEPNGESGLSTRFSISDTCAVNVNLYQTKAINEIIISIYGAIREVIWSENNFRRHFKIAF